MISEGSVPYKHSKTSFTESLIYEILLTCTVLTFIALSLLLGHQYATHNPDRRCMEHVSMYRKYSVQSFMCQTPIAYALSTRATRNETAMAICQIQRDPRASDRMDWGSKPRGRRRVGILGAHGMSFALQNVTGQCT